jgi:hypothetical protein
MVHISSNKFVLLNVSTPTSYRLFMQARRYVSMLSSLLPMTIQVCQGRVATGASFTLPGTRNLPDSLEGSVGRISL